MSLRKTPAKLYGRAGPLRMRSLVSQLKKEPDELKKKLLLVGYVTDKLERKSESVYLVGGQAVETYTGGEFRTGDIDLTTTDRKTTEEILEQIGFRRLGMVWLNETLGIAVHIVGLFPNRGIDKARTVRVGPFVVRTVGIEDLIVDRLAAAKFWKSQRDTEQAKALFEGFRKQIDMPYLRKRARDENVDDVLRT